MTTDQQPTRKFPLIPVLAGLGALVLITIVVLTFDGDSTSEFGDPAITGDALAFLPDGATDPALGTTAPEVTGSDFDDSVVSIAHDGTSKILLFVAHWCPHCQREVPIVQDWIDSAPLPDTVELIAVTTSISSTAENYPPSAWLDREGWTSPVLRDDATGSVANAFGLTAFPYWVFLDGDGTVLARLTGGIAVSDLDAAVATLQAQAAG